MVNFTTVFDSIFFCSHIAARQNHRDAVLLLLARGATFDCTNSKGQTPLDCAVPDSEVYSQLALNLSLRDMLSAVKHRSNTVLSRSAPKETRCTSIIGTVGS